MSLLQKRLRGRLMVPWQAVARGDLSETIDVEASGEIAELKTTVNGMVSLAYAAQSHPA